ncbi:branched-chain amino acid transport system ATP-binding protein [Paucidesulfovibrio gracilis DSM 16080]|uniref:Branched-chain amino acid transport system ATP-binding protein n=1 Tax=Paucidesulfovibrio gracilis DSM 16080 TaxID=1121449 RepID=A0A1T4WCZ9_9BACT|nr:ABC transporter ATP-binding protein [Paucidesulfovibrio gracilis]SKA75192.1 branched-chain amino acid transport system ATP-binding protein [Paucidesulfovibrio gracilis DSM 16080]
MAGETILELKEVAAHYGRIQALKGISLSVREGEVVSIIGANGAGKSTTLMTICGIVRASQGTVWYQGRDITRINADKLPRMGLCQVPEGRRIFPRLSVAENLDMGAFFRRSKRRIREDTEMVYDYFPRLRERRNQAGGTLSGGEQQMLAIGRALMSRPRLLLLDEPSLGLAPLIVQQIFDIVQTINKEQGVTILLVEQNANLALQASNRGYVLETGDVVMADDAAALLDNPDIRKAYLGE